MKLKPLMPPWNLPAQNNRCSLEQDSFSLLLIICFFSGDEGGVEPRLVAGETKEYFSFSRPSFIKKKTVIYFRTSFERNRLLLSYSFVSLNSLLLNENKCIFVHFFQSLCFQYFYCKLYIFFM